MRILMIYIYSMALRWNAWAWRGAQCVKDSEFKGLSQSVWKSTSAWWQEKVVCKEG